MYGIDGTERKGENLTDETFSNIPVSVNQPQTIPLATMSQASPPMQPLRRPRRDYAGEMMGSLFVPTVGLLLLGAPIEGTFIAYFVLSAGAGFLGAVRDVAYVVQNDIRMNAPGRFSIFSRGQNNNNLETPVVSATQSPD